MPHPLHSGLTFTPTLPEFAQSRAGSASTVISGGNNSGKSLVLKYLKSTMGKAAYMVGSNRFYHVYHFSTSIRDPNALDHFENNFQSNFSSAEYNYEQNHFDLNSIIVSLSDQQRIKLFELCGRLIGARFELKKIEPDNELSTRYIDVDGLNLSVSSTGTRLLMTILGICMDDRFKTLLIDEPELGLSPRVQRALAEFLHNPEERANYFPHLKQVVLATHSSLFLNRSDFSSNFVVTKSGTEISLTPTDTVSAFHRLQFNLLGNSLEGLFLPAAIVYVEGPTDQKFIERVISQRLPGRNIVLIQAGSDAEIKKKLYSLQESLGSLQSSPLRDRIFVIVDSVHTRGLKDDLVRIGLLPDNFISWSQNGIEYLYPPKLLASVFSCTESQLSEMQIVLDRVSYNGITHTKNELCELVLKHLSPETPLHEEFASRFLVPLTQAVGD